MKVTEVHQLLEKCKAATSADKIDRFYKLDDDVFRNLTPENIQTLAENYLAALELIQDLKSTAETHAMQSYSKTSWKNVEQANTFLKKVGIDASGGKV